MRLVIIRRSFYISCWRSLVNVSFNNSNGCGTLSFRVRLRFLFFWRCWIVVWSVWCVGSLHTCLRLRSIIQLQRSNTSSNCCCFPFHMSRFGFHGGLSSLTDDQVERPLTTHHNPISLAGAKKKSGANHENIAGLTLGLNIQKNMRINEKNRLSPTPTISNFWMMNWDHVQMDGSM